MRYLEKTDSRKQNNITTEENQVYDVAMEAGHILLQTGAEISSVE